MNQIIAAIMLFGITTVIFAPLIAESGSQIFSKSVSISDTMETSRQRAGEILVVTNTQQTNGTISISLSNIGFEDIRIHTVLVDGVKVSHIFKNQDLEQIGVFEAGDLGILEIAGTGSTVQLVSISGKLFEFQT